MVGPIGGIPAGAQRSSREDRQLAAIREEFPDLDFIKIFAGWLAVPKGTTVVQGMDLASVAEKLRQRGE
jgi:hypothetical protein